MYKNNNSIIAFALAMLCATSSTLYAAVIETSATIQVTASLQDQIRIENLDSTIAITGSADQNGNVTTPWIGSTSFKVIRVGAATESSLPYRLSISSSAGGSGDNFTLSSENEPDSTLDMNIDYAAADGETGLLTYNTFTPDTINTRLGFNTDNQAEDNITLNLNIPAESIQNAEAGSYSSIFTISVTAQ